jgi:uncharacterized surface protein with fasciclin (FAS1) repeats
VTSCSTTSSARRSPPPTLRQRASWWTYRTRTTGGLKLRFGAAGTTANGAAITVSDVEGVNGTVHVIDRVLTR